MLRFLPLILLLILLLPQRGLADENVAENVATPEPTLERMLGSMLMFGFRGSSLPDNDGFLKHIASGAIGNVILFDRDVTEGSARNIVSPAQLEKLTATLRNAAPGPIFIGMDQEGGQVRRLKPQKGFYDLPSAQSMGQGSPQATFEIADKLGQEMSRLGINLDLAPVVDVDSNPFNPSIGRLGRSFGTEAENVARQALAFGQGLAKNRVVPTLKHFPGQGCATTDSHLELPDVSQCWNAEVDLKPYADIFRQGWPGAVMIGHLFHGGLDPDLPTTLSPKVINGILRHGLGWQGVVISDDLQMKAIAGKRELSEVIRLAIEAGIDILLFGNNLEWDAELPEKVQTALRSLVDEGTISRERIKESWQRIQNLHNAYTQ